MISSSVSARAPDAPHGASPRTAREVSVPHVRIVDPERANAGIVASREVLTDVFAHRRIVVFHGEHPKAILVERKTPQNSELRTFGIQAPVVDHRWCAGLSQHRSDRTGLLAHGRRRVARRPGSLDDALREPQVTWLVFLHDSAVNPSGFEELDCAFTVVQATVDTGAAAIHDELAEQFRVRLNANACPAKRRFKELRVASAPAIRRAGVEKESAAHASEQFHDEHVLTLI